MSQSTQKSVKVKTPIILRKDNIRFNNWKVSAPQTQIIRESTVYESLQGDFLKGEYRRVSIVNKYNVLTNTSLTVAKCETLDGVIIEKTSESIARLIGQANYDILFSSLCSVISLEFKIRSILSILTVSNKLTDISTQTSQELPCSIRDDVSTQTEDRMEIFNKKPHKKRSKRHQLTPYVVQDTTETKPKVKKVIITPEEFQKKENEDSQSILSQVSEDSKLSQGTDSFPDLNGRLDIDESSRDSIGNISVSSTAISNAMLSLDLISEIDKHTEDTKPLGGKADLFPIKMLNGVVIYLQGKPESLFHIATAENLKQLPPADRQKLLRHQAYIDWKYCLFRSSDGNLPIHDAVLNNDLELLKRMSLVMVKVRKLSVDIPNGNNITALQMSLRQDTPECLSVLLSSGADPLATDEEHRSPLHIAAETTAGHVAAILDHCRNNARKILSSDEVLWKDRFENSSDEALGVHLLHHLNTCYNDQGYTPLMLASSIGKHENVKLLLESDPSCVNIKAPNSGDTALYQVVRAACLDAIDKGNKSIVSEHYTKTIQLLLKFDADPNIVNLAGFSSNDLVTDSNNKELSLIIANGVSVSNANKLPPGSNISNYIIMTDTQKRRKALKKNEPTKRIVKSVKTEINQDELLKTQSDDLNNIQTIYTEISVGDPQSIGTKKDLIDTKIDGAGTKIDAHGTKIDAHGTKIDAHGTKIDVNGTKIDVASTKLEVPGTKMHIAGAQKLNVRPKIQTFNIPSTVTQKVEFIDKFQSFIKTPSESNIIIIKDEVISPMKLNSREIGLKRRILDQSSSYKKKKEDV